MAGVWPVCLVVTDVFRGVCRLNGWIDQAHAAHSAAKARLLAALPLAASACRDFPPSGPPKYTWGGADRGAGVFCALYGLPCLGDALSDLIGRGYHHRA